MLEDIVDGDDVAVAAEPGGQPGLAAQAVPRAPGRTAGQGDRPVEREVMGEPDVLGAAAAEPALQHVAAGHEVGARRATGASPRRRSVHAGQGDPGAGSGLPQPGQVAEALNASSLGRYSPAGVNGHPRHVDGSPLSCIARLSGVGEGRVMAAPSLLIPVPEPSTPAELAAEAELTRVRAAAAIARDRLAEIDGVRVIGPEIASGSRDVRLALDLRDTGRDAWDVACAMAGRDFTLDAASHRVIVVRLWTPTWPRATTTGSRPRCSWRSGRRRRASPSCGARGGSGSARCRAPRSGRARP